jgi:hypothetical protein
MSSVVAETQDFTTEAQIAQSTTEMALFRHSIFRFDIRYPLSLIFDTFSDVQTTAMKKVLIAACWLFYLPVCAQNPASPVYPEDPASIAQPGVPKGELLKFSFSSSKIFPGTVRDYWVYVPAQYTGNEAACVYVNQDGIQWKAPYYSIT